MWNYSFYDKFDRKTGWAFDSKVVHGALGSDPVTGAVNFPIYQTTAFRYGESGSLSGKEDKYVQNPTCQELERTIAILEGGNQAFGFANGQTAVMAVLGMLEEGDHVVLSDSLCWGPFGICEDFCRKSGYECTFVNMSDMDQVNGAVGTGTRMLFAASPSDPVLKAADIKRLSEVSKRAGALLVVDNTLMTPYFQRPMVLGADMVIYSDCKYLGGHNDVNGGLVVVSDEEKSSYFKLRMKTQVNGCAGISPFDAWLLLRGLKTLALRMKRHQENAMEVAEWLNKHSKVKKVHYPGIQDDPAYQVMCWQASGFGGMISFELESEACVNQLLEKVKMVMFADSFGGTESMIASPFMGTRVSVPQEQRRKAGIHERLVRLSVGIEDVRDIVGDLGQALGV